MADIARITREVSDLRVQLTRSSLGDFAKFADGAEQSMAGEIFYLNHAPTEQVIREMGERGVSQRYLLDPEKYAPVGKLLDEVGATWKTYGEVPFKNHAKGFVRETGGELEAFITTGAFTSKTAERLEFVTSFKGDAAAALRGVIDAGIGADVKKMAAAAREAAKFGIVVNDSMAGATYLTDSVFDLVKKARENIVVSTKIYSDPRMIKLVDEAAARGVKVRFSDIRSQGMHGNLLVADDSMYFGTAHFSPRSLANGDLAYRKARDLGMVVKDKAAVDEVLKTMDAEQMPVYLADEFAQTR
ncbi:MAG: hypothetical protein JWM25_740, partial [Thermoleophilia bacterium]|nr:hypothetical protein [Thermoleophilia bacterium]